MKKLILILAILLSLAGCYPVPPTPLLGTTIRELYPEREILTQNHLGMESYTFVLPSKWVIVWREAEKHGIGWNDRIRAADSTDGGITLTNFRTVIAGYGYGAAMGGGVMANGRISLLMFHSGNLTKFIFSDDGGASWQIRAVGTSNGFAYYDRFEPYPFGGSSAFIAFGTYADNVGQNVKYLLTLDNGNTWTEGTALSVAAGDDVDEPTVTKLPGQNKWLMMIRRHHAMGLTAYASTSTNLINWTPVKDTGIRLSRNPHQIITIGDSVLWFMFNRLDEDVLVIGFPRDSILYQLVDLTTINTIFNNGGTGWPGWKFLVRVPNYSAGYLHLVPDGQGSYVGTFAGGGNAPIGLETIQRLFLISLNFGLQESSRAISARVYNTYAISIPNNQDVQLTFNSERWDTDNLHDPNVEPGVLVATKPGVYIIGGSVRFEANPNGMRQLEIFLNGGPGIGGGYRIANKIERAVFDTVTDLDINTQWYLKTGEKVRLYVGQTSGVTLNIIALSGTGSYTSPEFYMTLVGK